MQKLQDSCLELEQVLARVKDQCRDMLASLDRFNSYVASYAVGRLVRRLAILSSWVSAVAETLYREHESQGYVCVFLSEREGVHMLWVEREQIVAKRERYRAYGSTVLSVEEIVDIIDQLVRELDSGNWAKVVDWLHRYGKSPGLDFDRFPEIKTTGSTC
jgi:hypothetical protein